NPAVPAKTVKELVDLIKANPGKYSFGSAGAGTQAHLAGEQFRLSLGLDLVHVPFGGGGPAVAAVVAGHTPISFGSPQAAMQHVREGTVRKFQSPGSKPTTARSSAIMDASEEVRVWSPLVAPSRLKPRRGGTQLGGVCIPSHRSDRTALT